MNISDHLAANTLPIKKKKKKPNILAQIDLGRVTAQLCV